MGKWTERAQEAARQAAAAQQEDNRRRIEEASAARLAQERLELDKAQKEAEERQKQIDKEYIFSRAKAEKAKSVVEVIDQLHLEHDLEEIRVDVWNGVGKVEIIPTYFDGTVVGKTISLSAPIPARANLVTEDIYRMVRRWNSYPKFSNMGEPMGQDTYYDDPKMEAAGTKIIGVSIEPVTASLSVNYGFNHDAIRSDVPLSETSALTINFSNSNGKINNYESKFPTNDPNPETLRDFATQSLTLACAELLKDPFQAQMHRAQIEMEQMRGKIGESWLNYISNGEVVPTVGDRIRGMLK